MNSRKVKKDLTCSKCFKSVAMLVSTHVITLNKFSFLFLGKKYIDLVLLISIISVLFAV